MTTTQTRQALLDAFADDPFGGINGPALADSYEEDGEGGMAAAVRWMVANRRSPVTPRSQDGRPHWWNAAAFAEDDPVLGDIPADVFALLPGRLATEEWRAYDTFAAAVADLAQALAQIGGAP
jgi:hypothetical protein